MQPASPPKERTKRTESRRHPLLRGRPKGVWYPDAVGIVNGYAKTPEEFERRRELHRRHLAQFQGKGRGLMSRKGIPDGWAGRRPEVIAIRAHAAEQAKEIVKTMKELDLIKTDEDRAEAALEFAVSVIFAKDEKGKHTYQAREQLSAAKLVLEYTKQKPTTKNETTLHKAEDFLAAVAASMK